MWVLGRFREKDRNKEVRWSEGSGEGLLIPRISRLIFGNDLCVCVCMCVCVCVVCLCVNVCVCVCVVSTAMCVARWKISIQISPFYFLFFKGRAGPQLFRVALGLRCCAWAFSPCRGYSSCGASLVAKHRLYGMWALVVRHSGSVVVGHGLSCSMACGIFPDRESNPCPLHWQADSYPPYHQGSPRHHPFKKLVCNILVLEIIFLVNNNNTQNERNQKHFSWGWKNNMFPTDSWKYRRETSPRDNHCWHFEAFPPRLFSCVSQYIVFSYN